MEQSTLGDLRRKEVISVTDGTRFGFVGDLSFHVETGQINAIIVPGTPRFFGLFGHRELRYIPWEDIRRMGEDIILVEGGAQLPQTRRERGKWRE